MRTETIKVTSKNIGRAITKAARVIKRGELVVFPTETVYGLGANVFDEEALRKIFKAKGRPSENPIIVHIDNPSQLKTLTDRVSKAEQKLIDKFWPGPLTIIFRRKKNISKVVSGGLPTIAVRMPSHPLARALIRESGVSIAAPSANISGRPSGTTSAHIHQDLLGRVSLILDTGPSGIGLESTVVKVEGNKILILRPGAVTKEDLKSALPGARVILLKNDKKSLYSPGTSYRHYSPEAKLEIKRDRKSLRLRQKALENKGIKVGVLKRRSNKETARNLYRDLRKLDAKGADVILVESLPKKGLGAAIMDRLLRASQAGETDL